MNAKQIQWLLAKRGSSPVFCRRMLAVVPNVSWSMLPWEADLLALKPSGYLTEIEIKVSMSDWKADHLKAKWRTRHPEAQLIKHFYYAAPDKLAERHQEIQLEPSMGVIAVSESGIRVLRHADARTGHRKLTEKEQSRLLRLAAIKAWGLFHKPSPVVQATRVVSDDDDDRQVQTTESGGA